MHSDEGYFCLMDEHVILSVFDPNATDDIAINLFVWLVTEAYECEDEDCLTD